MNPSIASIGRSLFRLRSLAPVPMLVLAAYLLAPSRGHPGPGGASVDHALNHLGFGVSFVGQALRFYTLGQVPDGTSGQGSTLEAVQLNTQGPYAHVRNPLYVGNLGICLGLLLIAHHPGVYALLLGAFFTEYFFIIRAEEAFLKTRFGKRFEEYCARVPRWFPRLTPAYPGQLRQGFDWGRALRKEHNPFAAWTLLGLSLLTWEMAAQGTLRPVFAWSCLALGLAVGLLFLIVKSHKRGLWGARRQR